LAEVFEGGGTQPIASPLPTQRNKNTKTDIPRVRFQPAIPVFSWLETGHALDRAAADEAEFGLDSCSRERVFMSLAVRRVAVDREGLH
jgi:hypothetical protein